MKKIVYILLVAFAAVGLVSAQSADIDLKTKWKQANDLYKSNDYTAAILIYEEILGSDSHSAKAYYNLGNAYFKNNNIGKAILNYNRALLLDPGNDDIQHNLMIAGSRTIDKIEPTPQFFLKSWIIDVGGIFNSDMWAVLTLVFVAITFGGIVLWLISTTMILRKTGFYAALFAAILAVTSLIYSQYSYEKQISVAEAIVMNSAAPVKSAPATSGKDLFLLHEGTKVKVIDSMDQWSEIELEDGNKGWIQQAALERIN